MVTAMASVKLVNCHQPHYYLHQHYPLLLANSSPEENMTLDYNIAHRSRSTDGDPENDSMKDMSPPQSPEGSDCRDPNGMVETPTKKNKRKLSEPKKRDFSAKRLCSSSPNLHVGNMESELDKGQAGTEEQITKGKKFMNGHSKRSSSMSSSKSPAHVQSKNIKRDTSSSSSSSASNNDIDKDNPLPSLSNGISSHFLHPMFTGVHPSTLGYVPGVYFSGRPFHHAGIHASFPAIPLHIQHSYIAAAAAAAAAAATQSPPCTSLESATVTSSVPVPGSVTSRLEGSPSTSHQSTALPVVHSPVQSSATSSLALQPEPESSGQKPSAPLYRPSSTRTATSNNDEDETLASRAQSPEDLSLGGKLSRKHRKNYKNMTRERRVEANARERTRVHTISAAFDALRRAVPSYSHNQKLSKLAILRIASSYIMALARLSDVDYTSASEHIGKPLTFAECVDMCTNTIQTEGRARRRH